LVINLVNPLDAELADLAAAHKGLLGSALRAAGGRTGGAFHITHGEVPRRGWRIRGGRRVRPRARSPRARKPPRGGASGAPRGGGGPCPGACRARRCAPPET